MYLQCRCTHSMFEDEAYIPWPYFQPVWISLWPNDKSLAWKHTRLASPTIEVYILNLDGLLVSSFFRPFPRRYWCGGPNTCPVLLRTAYKTKERNNLSKQLYSKLNLLIGTLKIKIKINLKPKNVIVGSQADDGKIKSDHFMVDKDSEDKPFLILINLLFISRLRIQ